MQPHLKIWSRTAATGLLLCCSTLTANAYTLGSVAPPSEDTNDGELSGQSRSASIYYLESTSTWGSELSNISPTWQPNYSFVPMIITLNTNNSNDTILSINTLKIFYDTGRFTNVTLDGSQYTNMTDVAVSYEENYSADFCYTYNSTDLCITISKDANSHTLNGFTVAAAADTVAPMFDVAPSVDSETSSGFTPSASIDEEGKIYYVVVADGAAAPSAAQVRAGNDSTGSSAIASSSITVSSSSFTSNFSPITSLSSGTAYDVYFVAEDDEVTPNLQSSVVKVDATTSIATPAAPTGLSATAGDGQVSVSFTAPTNTGGAAITNYEYTTDGGSNWTAFSPATTSTSVTITGLTNGTSYDIALRPVNSAGSGSASAVITVNMRSQLSEFEDDETQIRQAVEQDVQRSLSATLGINRRMNEEALTRFIDARRSQDGDDTGFVGRNDVPLDVDGVLRIDGTTFSTRGDFFAQQGSMDGSSRRLFFGDFNLQRDGDSGSTTATVTARLAWERMLSDTTMLGYFVGGELAFSDIEGAFTGDQDRIGATVGLYAVHALDEQLFLDGFVTLGAGRNDLGIANDVLDLDSTYTTRTFTIGGALSGVYEYGHYEFRPELAFSYGKTWIGNVGFTGTAYGLVDDTLSLDAGSVSIANLTLRPEVIWALDADTVAESRSQLSFSPRLVCEHTIAFNQTQDCGGGAEVGLSSMSDDGMSNIEFRVLADRVGSSTRSSFAINLEHRF